MWNFQSFDLLLICVLWYEQAFYFFFFQKRIEFVIPCKDMDFKWDIPLCCDKVHKAIGIVFLTIKNRKDSSVQWYTLPLSVILPVWLSSYVWNICWMLERSFPVIFRKITLLIVLILENKQLLFVYRSNYIE